MKESVIIFGTGKIFNRTIKQILEKYDVAFCVDNNKNLWGTTIEKIPVFSPREIIDKKEKIIIATNIEKYVDILSQIDDMGVDSERVYWAYYQYQKASLSILPAKFELWPNSDLDLVNYDLLKNDRDDGKGVLLLCTFHSTYPVNLIRNIKKRFDISISLLTYAHEYKEDLEGVADHIYCYDSYFDLLNILYRLPVYSVIHALWIENVWAYFYREINRKCKKLHLFVGGSELYRANEKELELKTRIIDIAQNITVETTTVRDDFLKVYPAYKNKMILLRYGLEYIECCNNLPDKKTIRDHFGISENKIVVTCAHNANPAHQHEKIIDAIERIDQELKDKAVFVFPMTYGNPSGDHIEEIRKRLENSNLDYMIFDNFMEYRELAEYISISDIMIHVQITDALSTNMLEHMYAGSVTIAGSWLPYQSLREKGIEFLSIDSIDVLDEALKEVIIRLDEYKIKCKKNRELIQKMSGWSTMSKKWVELWRHGED